MAQSARSGLGGGAAPLTPEEEAYLLEQQQAQQQATPAPDNYIPGSTYVPLPQTAVAPAPAPAYNYEAAEPYDQPPSNYSYATEPQGGNDALWIAPEGDTPYIVSRTGEYRGWANPDVERDFTIRDASWDTPYNPLDIPDDWVHGSTPYKRWPTPPPTSTYPGRQPGDARYTPPAPNTDTPYAQPWQSALLGVLGMPKGALEAALPGGTRWVDAQGPALETKHKYDPLTGEWKRARTKDEPAIRAQVESRSSPEYPHLVDMEVGLRRRREEAMRGHWNLKGLFGGGE